jgi:opacity protein-like surface antigen
MFAVGTLIALPAFSQASLEYKFDVAVQAFGSFVKSTVSDGVEQKATHSGGVLGSYRYFFNNHHGAEFNYGYSLNTQQYGLNNALFRVPAYSHEATAAYVFRYPLRRITPFALAGVGGLMFNPKDTPLASMQARPAFLYGGGADFNITDRFFLRAQYRGLVYNSPNFDVPILNVDRVTHRAEPSAGFGFRF